MRHCIPWIKTVGYPLLTGVLLWLSVSWQSAMRTATRETAFFHALFGCFVISCCLIGAALYAWIGYVRRVREHRADVWLCLTVGAALMVLTLVAFFRYGGLESISHEEGARAENFLMVVLSVLPLPFTVRALTLALPGPRESRTLRYTAWGLAAASVLAYVLLTVCGGLFRLVP